MNKENCALKLVDEIILYYDARSKKHQITNPTVCSHIAFKEIFVFFLQQVAYFSLNSIYCLDLVKEKQFSFLWVGNEELFKLKG